MKKILLTSIALAGCLSAFGQGQIIFENADNSSSFVTLNKAGNPATGSGLVVELFWNNGSSFVLQNTFTSTFTGLGQNGQSAGEFTGPQLTIPQSGTQTFEVEGFYTSGGIAYSGNTGSFTANATVSPAPVGKLDLGSWNGDLVLNPLVPEPTTLALGGLGAAALLLFRR